MPRAGRKTAIALVVSSLLVMGFLAAMGGPALAQDGNETAAGAGGASGNATGDASTGGGGAADAAAGMVRTVTVGVKETGCPKGADPCWDLPSIPIGAGETVVLVGNWKGHDNTHNMHVTQGLEQLPAATKKESDALQEIRLTIPADARTPITFVCDVHPKTMIAELLPPTAFAALSAGGHEDVPEMGVHFLAYWVGVMAFAILFVVYGITFFLFKYNETSATTDHWDRSGSEPAGKRVGGGAAGLLAVVIAVAAIGAIIWLARFR